MSNFISFASLAASEALALGLIEHQAMNNEHVTVPKDEKRRKV